MGTGQYRGRERRRSAATAADTAWFAAGGTLAVSQAWAFWLVWAGVDELSMGPVIVGALHGAEVVVAIAVAATGLAHWRAVGRAHGARLAVAGIALWTVAWLELLTVLGVVADPAPGIQSALGLTAATWFARAVWGPEVDTGLRLWRELLGALAVLAVAAVVMGVVLGSPTHRPLVVGAAWVVVAVVGLVRSARRGWVLMAWASWAAVGFALSEVARFTAVAADPGWTVVSASMGAAGLLVAAVGGTWVLAVAARTHRSEVHGTLLDGLTMQEQADVRRRELAHEVRNAAFVLEGAVAGIAGANRGRPDEELQDLRRVVASGLSMLRQVVATPADADHEEPFRLDDVVADCVAAARARRVPVRLSCDRAVAAVGDAATTGRALTNLIVNAERHGHVDDDHPVCVSIDVDEGTGRAAVRVCDDGPGIAPALREHAFTPGGQVGPDRSGDGLGLPLARDLARRQGGELWYEGSDEDGSCFVLSLPLADATLVGAVGQVDDRADDRRDALDTN